MARTNTPQEYAQAVLSEIKRQKNREDNKQLQSLKKENDKLFGEVTKLKEQAKVLQSEAKKVSKLETKLSNEISKGNERQRKIANLNRAVVGLKREWRIKFDNLKEDIVKSRAKKTDKQEGGEDAGETKESTREKAKALKKQQGETKRLLKAFQRQTLDPTNYTQDKVDIGELKNRIENLSDSAFKYDALYALNKTSTTALKKEEQKKAKQQKEEEREAKKKLKEEQALDKAKDKNIKSYGSISKSIDKVNNKLNLFGIALTASNFVKWGYKTHAETKQDIQASFRAGLNLQQGREWMMLSNIFGVSAQAIFGEMAELMKQKDLIERGGKVVFTEAQQRFLLSGLPNSLKLNQQDWLSKSPQELFMLITKTAFTKAQKDPEEASAILAGLKEAGFSEIAELIRTALLYQLDLKQVMFKVSQLVDVPMDAEVKRSRFTLVWEETITRLVNKTDELALAFQKLITPLLEIINKIPILRTSQEKIAEAKEYKEAYEGDDRERQEIASKRLLESNEDSSLLNQGLYAIGLKDMEEREADQALNLFTKIVDGDADKSTLPVLKVILGKAKHNEKLRNKIAFNLKMYEEQFKIGFTENQRKMNYQNEAVAEALRSELNEGGKNIDIFSDYVLPNLVSTPITHMQNLGASYSQPSAKEVVVITAKDQTQNGVKFDVESSDNSVRFINQ